MWVCGGQRATVAGSSPSTSAFAYPLIIPPVLNLSFMMAWYNRPILGSTTKLLTFSGTELKGKAIM